MNKIKEKENVCRSKFGCSKIVMHSAHSSKIQSTSDSFDSIPGVQNSAYRVMRVDLYWFTPKKSDSRAKDYGLLSLSSNSEYKSQIS